MEEVKGQVPGGVRCHIPEHLFLGPNGVSMVVGSITSPKFICKAVRLSNCAWVQNLSALISLRVTVIL